VKLFLLSIFIFKSFVFLSQEENDFNSRLIDGEELREDLIHIRRVILQSQPNPFVYIGKSSWDSSFLSLMEYFEEPRTLYDFTFNVSEWLNQLKDSHVGISLWDQLSQHDLHSILNFNLTRIENKFYASYFPMNSVPLGNEILEINSVTVDTLFKQACVFALQEGNSFNAKEQYATDQIQVLYNLLYQNKYGIEQKIPVKHVNYSGDTIFSFVKTINLNNSPDQLRQFLNIQIKEIDYQIDVANKLAIIKVHSFYPQSKKKYFKLIDHFFDTISNLKISKLIIDIRSNTGGYFDCVDHLINYLDNSSVSRTTKIVEKRSKYDRFESSNFLLVNFLLKIQKLLNSSQDAKYNYRFYKLPYGSQDTLINLYTANEHYLNKKRYLGKCYLAMNGTSMSASVYCASLFKRINRGKIIGEPCMGPITGTCGNPTQFFLKNTRVSVLTSTSRFYVDPTFMIQTDPIFPDIYIKKKLSNFRNKIDDIHEYVLND